MANYAKLRLGIEASENADYGQAQALSHTMTLTPDEWELGCLMEADQSGATTVYHNMGTITSLVIKNEDADNAITVTWAATNYAGSASTCAMHIPAGKFCVLSEVTAGTAITIRADTAAALARVTIFGT